MNRLVARTMIGPGIGCAAFLALCGVTAAQQAPDTELPRSTSPVPSSGRLDVNQSVRFLEAGARPTSGGRCAQVVSRALEAGGLDVKARGIHAKDFGPHLERSGFKKLPAEGYVPEPGDVVVLQPYRGGPSTGHVAIFTGEQWISDFRQKDFYGGSGYRKGGAAYAFYRHTNVVVASEPPVDATKLRSQQAAGTKPHDAAMTEAAEPSKPKDEQTEKLQRRAKELAEKGLKPRDSNAPVDPDEAKPIIPEDCTLEIVTWTAENPQGRATTTCRVLGGRVTAQAPDIVQEPYEKPIGKSSGTRWVNRFEGTLTDNVLRGTWRRSQVFPEETWNWSVKKDDTRVELVAHRICRSEGTSELDLVLNADGTCSWKLDGTGSSKTETLLGDVVPDNTWKFSLSGVGVWQIRKNEAVPSDSKDTPR